MSFFERLKRQQEEAMQSSRRQVAEAERLAREWEVHQAAFEREEAIRDEQRKRALNNSSVPQMARVLGNLTGGNIVLSEKGTTLDVEWPDEEHSVVRYIRIEGIEDGSVRIGDMELNPGQVRDRQAIEEALESACKKPNEYWPKAGSRFDMFPGDPGY